MELPSTLQAALEEELKSLPQKELLSAAEAVSLRYRERKARGFYIGNRKEALAYALARMPATYGAVHTALSSALAAFGEGGRLPRGPLSLLDLGAGTGAASWAAAGLLELSSINCLEYAPSMEAVGKSLMRRGEGPLKDARWKQADLASQPIGEEADVVVASYMLNELEQSAGLRAAEKAWQAAGKLLLLVEPGTPEGYGVLRGIREALLRRGAHVLAPCPHREACPLPPGEWCHFSCRIQRSRLHIMAKGGEAPYEDEKFTFLALSREPVPQRAGGRVLRHPYTGKGYVKLELCAGEGLLQKTVSKREGALYKAARKAGWGDWLSF